MFVHQTCPYETKSRCSGVKAADFPASAFLPTGELSIVISAIRSPPLSAVFSPSVSSPLTLVPGVASKPEYSSTMHLVRASNFFLSSSVHQSRRLPAASNLRPDHRNRA
jgi:hypothetical protein